MDEPDVIWIPSPNCFSGRSGYTPRWLILHGTAGFRSAQDVGNFFQQPKSQVSSHYVIGQDGVIVQCVSEQDGAWANGGVTAGHDSWWSSNLNPNFVTISIEHVKPSIDNSDQLTEVQKEASFRLVSHICQRHNIPMRAADAQGGITGHHSMDPVNRSRCPGPYPWDELFAFLENGGIQMIDLDNPIVASYFTAVDTGHWQCIQNGNVIFGGILAFYRRFGGSGLNGLTHLGLPLTNEMYPRPGIALQHFERGILAYDPQHEIDNPPAASDVYLMHLNDKVA